MVAFTTVSCNNSLQTLGQSIFVKYFFLFFMTFKLSLPSLATVAHDVVRVAFMSMCSRLCYAVDSWLLKPMIGQNKSRCS